MPSDIGNNLGPILGVVVALIIVAAAVTLGLRHSARSNAGDREQVELVDAAMITVATHTSLRHLPGPVFEHPVVGPIRGYGRLDGTLDGVEVHVVIERQGTSEPYVDELRIEVVRAPGPAPSDEALARLRGLGLEVRVTPERLVAVPHLGRAGAVHTQVYDFPSDPETLEAYIRATADAARGGS